jgi:transposase
MQLIDQVKTRDVKNTTKHEEKPFPFALEGPEQNKPENSGCCCTVS